LFSIVLAEFLILRGTRITKVMLLYDEKQIFIL